MNDAGRQTTLEDAGGRHAPFPLRGIHLCESLLRHTPGQLDRLLERILEWRCTAIACVAPYGWARYGGTLRAFAQTHGIRLIRFVHSSLAFGTWMEAEDFARSEDGRPRTERLANETWLCPSRESTRDRFRRGVRRYLEREVCPGDEIVIAPADGFAICACPECRRLGAPGQWNRLFQIAAEEMAAFGGVKIHFIAYVGRFSPPADPAVLRHVTSVCFDLHLRYRWAPLEADHPLGLCEALEGRHDGRASRQPINRYLLDRLGEWRRAFGGELYLFENLMLQGTFSCPQPNTGALLRDQDTFRRLGVEGILYEAFEPGVSSFTAQMATLTGGWMGELTLHAPTRLESLCRGMPDATVVRARVLAFLVSRDFDGLAALAEAWPDDAALVEYARRLAAFLPAPSAAGWRHVVEWVLRHEARFDWIYIAFRLASYVPQQDWPADAAARHADFLATHKPWDLQERLADPIADMRATITDLIRACGTDARIHEL